MNSTDKAFMALQTIDDAIAEIKLHRHIDKQRPYENILYGFKVQDFVFAYEGRGLNFFNGAEVPYTLSEVTLNRYLLEQMENRIQ